MNFLRLAALTLAAVVTLAWAADARAAMTVESNIDARGITFGANSSSPTVERMRITQFGNVGIGTTTPTTTLQVSGTFTVSASAQTSSPSFYVATNGYVGIGTNAPTLTPLTGLEIRGTSGGSSGLRIGTPLNSWELASPGSAANGNFYLRNTATGSFGLYILSGTEAVGISTTSPKAKLDVNGTISASDAIQVGASSLTCGAGITGAIRYNSSASSLEFCDGSNWTAIGSAGVYGYELNTNSQATGAAVGWYYATCSAGKKIIGGACSSSGGGTYTNTAISGNAYGCYKQNTSNGYTEYAVCAQASTSTTTSGASPAGSTGDVQFNTGGALDADTGLFTYTTGATGGISATRVSSTYASLTTIYNPGSFSGNSIAANSVSATSVSASTISGTDVQVGAGGTCAAALVGKLRWNSTSNTLQVCPSSGVWTSLVSGSAGVSSLAALTDTNITNVAGNDYLQYNAVTSKWVNISASTVMSTTTMAPNWPDAIACTAGTTTVYLLPNSLVSGGNHVYIYGGGATVTYTNTGAYSTQSGLTGYDCVTSTYSINQLAALGKTWNYVGSYTRWNDINGFTDLTANPVGIGVTVSSTAKFEVAGLVSVTSLINSGGLTVLGAASMTTVSASTISGTDIQVGAGGTCAAALVGKLRWNSTSNTLQVCPSSGVWTSLVSGTAGVSSLAALTDTNLTNVAGRDYLRYDAPTSKWVNISESTAMSTTTIEPGWPDAIYCSYSGGQMLLYRSLNYTSTPSMFYENNISGTRYLISFNYPAATYLSNGSLPGSDCLSKSISQLYAAGKAFNFIGGANRWQDISGFTYLSSNPVGINVTVSSSAQFEVNGLTSLTTVSATAVSATDVQIGTGGTCGATMAGKIRYNSASNTLQICPSTGVWTSLSSGTTVGSGVTGGTANYGAIFSGASTLTTDSAIYVDTTNHRLGVGTTTPGYALDVNGYASAVNFYQTSDRRLKKDITPIVDGLGLIKQLQPVTFSWKKDGRPSAGLIAQEVEPILPSAIVSNSAGTYSLDYIQTIPYLIRSVQQLQAANDNLNRKVIELEERLDARAARRSRAK